MRQYTPQTQTKKRIALQQMAREHRLLIDTPDGVVDAISTCAVWGEGDNVDGFKWALRSHVEQNGTLDSDQTDRLLGEGYHDLARGWAADHADDE